MIRFVLERHSDNNFWCWRVRDTVLDQPHGFGLLESDASWLANTLEIEHAKDPL